jgi:integrase/recombinase XerD
MAKGLKLPEFLDDDERQALLAQPNPKCPTGFRNLTLLSVMLDCGLRESEALHLRVKDVDWKKGTLFVRQGKGHKDRRLGIPSATFALLVVWKDKRPYAVATDLLFATLKGEPIDARYVRTMVKRLAKQAGIEKDVHPHTLRHTFATDLYRRTRDILLVSKALGHASLQPTQIYTHLANDDVTEARKGLRQE